MARRSGRSPGTKASAGTPRSATASTRNTPCTMATPSVSSGTLLRLPTAMSKFTACRTCRRSRQSCGRERTRMPPRTESRVHARISRCVPQAVPPDRNACEPKGFRHRLPAELVSRGHSVTREDHARLRKILLPRRFPAVSGSYWARECTGWPFRTNHTASSDRSRGSLAVEPMSRVPGQRVIDLHSRTPRRLVPAASAKQNSQRARCCWSALAINRNDPVKTMWSGRIEFDRTARSGPAPCGVTIRWPGTMCDILIPGCRAVPDLAVVGYCARQTIRPNWRERYARSGRWFHPCAISLRSAAGGPDCFADSTGERGGRTRFQPGSAFASASRAFISGITDPETIRSTIPDNAVSSCPESRILRTRSGKRFPTPVIDPLHPSRTARCSKRSSPMRTGTVPSSRRELAFDQSPELSLIATILSELAAPSRATS